jgi:hypothetical protein
LMEALRRGTGAHSHLAKRRPPRIIPSHTLSLPPLPPSLHHYYRAIIGELDEDLDAAVNWDAVKATAPKAIVHTIV